MARIWKISEAVSLGLHAMVLLAAEAGERRQTREMAVRLQASEAHLSKVLQRLGKAGLVKAVRGPGGGFTLSRPAYEITLLEVYEAIEGPLEAGTPCLLGEPICGGKKCILGTLSREITEKVWSYLARTTLAALVDVYPRSKGSLAREPASREPTGQPSKRKKPSP